MSYGPCGTAILYYNNDEIYEIKYIKLFQPKKNLVDQPPFPIDHLKRVW